jgi:hypothetical protein
MPAEGKIEMNSSNKRTCRLDDIKMDLKEIRCEQVEWSQLLTIESNRFRTR